MRAIKLLAVFLKWLTNLKDPKAKTETFDEYLDRQW